MALSCCKKLSVLIKEITSNHKGDFYCLKCVHLFRTENHKNHKNVCESHDYCYIEMPKEGRIKCKHGEKSMKVLFIIFADMES